jgi:hypothetical protein
MRPAFVTKPGKHGTLYRYVITYTDRTDDGFGEHMWCTWAYNLDHAEENFYANDEGFSIVNLRRLHEGPTRRCAQAPRRSRKSFGGREKPRVDRSIPTRLRQ